jgi:hypothetical protein
MTMTKTGRVIMLIAVMLAALIHTTFAQQPDPRREPATAIREAIRLLESKSHTEFVQKCMSPIQVDRAKTQFGTLENAVAEFGRRGGFESALKAFQAAMKVQPTFNGDGTRANYAFDAPIGGEVRLQLRKIDGLWYWAD